MGSSASPQPQADGKTGPKVTMLSADQAAAFDPRRKKRPLAIDPITGPIGWGGQSTLLGA